MNRTPIPSSDTAFRFQGATLQTPSGPITALDGFPALVYRCATADGVEWLTDVVAVSRLLMHAPETEVSVTVVSRTGGHA